MKICFVLNHSPDKIGGTPFVVKNLRKYIKSDFMAGAGEGIYLFLSSFATGFKLLFKKYDIVNIQDTQGYFYSILPKSHREKIVYTCHGLWAIHFSIFPSKGILGKIKAKSAMYMQEKIIKKSDHIISVSYFIKNELIKRYNIDGKKISVVHNGVDTKRFHNMNKKRLKNLALWVGNDPKRKGLDDAIAYAKKHKMKLWIIGIEGKSNDSMKYFGRVSEHFLIEAYNTASVLLFFTKAEAHPLVPLEAMACGLGIIASKESNIEIFPPKSDGNYQITGKKALSIIKKYDWKNQAKQHLKIYEEVYNNEKT